MNGLTDSINETKVSYTINSTTENNIDRSFIDRMQEESIIRMTDSDDTYGLQLFCYENCDKFDSDRVKQSRGVVFSGDVLIMKAFPYTEEINGTNIEEFESKLKLSECRSFFSYEGMLIRMFYFVDKWFISTHRKLDAFRSKWSSKISFGEIFVECLQREYEHNESFVNSLQDTPDDLTLLERFQKTLDTTKQYMFLLLNNEENRIVCVPDLDGPGMYHVGTFDSRTLLPVDVDINISKPREMQNKPLSLREVYEHAQYLDYTRNQGIIIFTPDNKQYKVLNDKYSYYFSIRGNEPSIKFRYLQVRMNPEYNKTLRTMYLSMCKTFDMYETYISNIAKNIFNSYIERFIKKKFVTVSQEEYIIVKACHNWHLQDRKRNIVNLKKVLEEINNSSPSLINKMIKTQVQKEKK